MASSDALRLSLYAPRRQAATVDELFERKEIVGKGAYGGVYRGIHRETGTVVALKVIDLDTPDDDITEIQREVALLSQLKHTVNHNIIMYHDCYLNGHELWIVMDFASGGSIRTMMKSGPIEEQFIAIIVREVLVALAYLHGEGIIHRDIKAANVLLTQDGRISVADFGVAAHLLTNHKRSTFIGTPLWMAPEVITDGKLYDAKADIWSLGITAFEIATGNPPFFGIEPLRACAMIPTAEPATLGPGPWSDEMRNFLALCMQVNPEDRPSATELKESAWIASNADAPLYLLRELIVRYLAWVQRGGQRMSLASIDQLAREDTFDISDELWDFDAGQVPSDTDVFADMTPMITDEPRSEHSGGRGMNDVYGNYNEGAYDQGYQDTYQSHNQGGPYSERPSPPGIFTHIVPPSRPHALMRLFDAEETHDTYGLPQQHVLQGVDVEGPVISIPTFEEMDDMAEDVSITIPSDLDSESWTAGASDVNGGTKVPISTQSSAATPVMHNPFPWTRKPAQTDLSKLAGLDGDASTPQARSGEDYFALPPAPVGTEPNTPVARHQPSFVGQPMRLGQTSSSAELTPVATQIDLGSIHARKDSIDDEEATVSRRRLPAAFSRFAGHRRPKKGSGAGSDGKGSVDGGSGSSLDDAAHGLGLGFGAGFGSMSIDEGKLEESGPFGSVSSVPFGSMESGPFGSISSGSGDYGRFDSIQSGIDQFSSDDFGSGAQPLYTISRSEPVHAAAFDGLSVSPDTGDSYDLMQTLKASAGNTPAKPRQPSAGDLLSRTREVQPLKRYVSSPTDENFARPPLPHIVIPGDLSEEPPVPEERPDLSVDSGLYYSSLLAPDDMYDSVQDTLYRMAFLMEDIEKGLNTLLT